MEMIAFKTNSVLDFVGCVRVHDVSTTFVAVEHFVEKTDCRSKVPFDRRNLDHLWSTFLKGEGKVERVEARTVLYCYRLMGHLYFSDILLAIGDEAKAETALADIYALLLKQPNGKKGILHAGPSELNIFFVRDMYDVLRPMILQWRNDHWLISAGSIDRSCGYGKGHKVFLRHFMVEEPAPAAS